MKRVFRIFELTKNEQRVVLVVMLILLAIAFMGYQHRVHHPVFRQVSATDARSSPTPVETEGER